MSRPLGFFFFFFLVGTVQAAAPNWHGFVSQGLIYTSGNNFVDPEQRLSHQLTEVGFNGSWQLNNDLRLAGQVVYLNGGNRYPVGKRLDYLFLDWRVAQTEHMAVNLHLGRFKNYHWLYSATRDVPHTRSSIILPQSVYFDGFRDIAVGSDGVSLLANFSNALGDWDMAWSYGTSPISGDQTRQFFSDLATGRIDQDFVHQLSLQLRPNAGPLQLGLSLLDSDFSYEPGAQDFLSPGQATTQRVMLQLRYDAEHWDLTSEFLQERVIFNGLLGSNFFQDTKGQGAYVQGRYFLSPDWTLLARVDVMDLDKDDRNGARFSQATGIPAYFRFSDMATLGVTRELPGNWRLQAEIHRVRGAGRLTPVLLADTVGNDQEFWTAAAIQLMTWF